MLKRSAAFLQKSFCVAALLFAALTFACSDDGTGPEPDAAEPDAAEPESIGDAGTVTDGGDLDAGGTIDAGAPNGPCSFNRDCRPEQRCECDEVNGCACADGTRGAGTVGIDACASGNDCVSSLCLEGPNDALVCSGPCDDDNDCAGSVPVCADIAFVGRICIREAD